MISCVCYVYFVNDLCNIQANCYWASLRPVYFCNGPFHASDDFSHDFRPRNKEFSVRFFRLFFFSLACSWAKEEYEWSRKINWNTIRLWMSTMWMCVCVFVDVLCCTTPQGQLTLACRHKSSSLTLTLSLSHSLISIGRIFFLFLHHVDVVCICLSVMCVCVLSVFH